MIGEDKIKTTCSYCGVGCGILVWKDEKGELKIEGDKMHPVNRGMLCSKGRNLNYVADDVSDRILYPAIKNRHTGEFERKSWDESIFHIAEKFKSIIKEHGADAVAFYVSGQCLTEEYYVVNKLAKAGLGTNNIDTNSRLCMSSAVVGYKQVLGEDSVPVSYEDIELSDCIYITGANPAYCHPILFRRLEEHKEKNPGLKIIVADPRRTQSCELADIHLQLKPGTDIVLNHAISRLLIENNWIDIDFICNHTDGYEELKEVVFQKSLTECALICGLSEQDIFQTARLIGESEGFISMWAMGLNQSVVGVEKNVSLLNISLLTGKIGKPGSGPFSLTGQPNAMGGREVGGMCNMLPAHRSIENECHRKEVADFWGVSSIPQKSGYSATEMFDAVGQGKLKAIWIICTNPLISLPNLEKLEKNLLNADLVVVQDISYNSDTVSFADVLLPAAGWLEKEGTMTNSERRISYLPQYINAPGEALPDMEIFCRFAQALNLKGFNFSCAEDAFVEHAALTAGTNMNISELDYSVLKEKGTVQWPYSKEKGVGAIRLFEDAKFFTASGNAQFKVSVQEFVPPQQKKDELILTTGRVRDQWHTMTKTSKVQRLIRHTAEPFVEIHPSDAKSRSIQDGDLIEIWNENGNSRVKAKVSDKIRKGVVFMPMHWGKQLNSIGARANNLTFNRVDPVSKEPDFKFAIVRCKKHQPEIGPIVVVGGGAAAYKFVSEFRKKNRSDKVLVISKEAHAFYDRVQLPDYITGERDWDMMMKATKTEVAELNIKLIEGVSIVEIDKKKKIVTDSTGNKHSYSKLILAMGAKANLPEQYEKYTKGVYTIRTRHDADSLKMNLKPGDRILVSGGSLLGLEIAGAMAEIGMHVDLVHRGETLMQRQLDKTASRMLLKQVKRAGVNVILNQTIESIAEEDNQLNVVLKSTARYSYKSVVFAYGTKPNIALAVNAGIEIGNSAIVVNSNLESSSKDIYALGEVAEWKGKRWGITAAAEEQAEILANNLNGDPMAIYKGSLSMNILKFPGIELCSMGFIPGDTENVEDVILLDNSKNYYKRCIVKNDRLVGAIMIGDKSEMLDFKNWISTGIELVEIREKLLRPGVAKEAVKGKMVCSCLNVGEGNIMDSIQSGCLTVEDISKVTGAGTGCGSCKPELKSLLVVRNFKN